MTDLLIFETSFSEKICTAAEQAIKHKFPEIQNLTIDMNEDGYVSIIFDETIYTQQQVQDFMNEFKKQKL